MKSLKKIAVIFIALLVLTYIGVTINSKNSGDNNIYVPPPKIPIQIDRTYQVKFDLDENNINIPSTVPVISFNNSTPINIEEAQNIANNLEYTEAPQTVNDVVDGTVYLWNNISGPLFVYADIRKIDYSYAVPTTTIDKKFTNEDNIKIARDFLESKFEYESGEVEFAFTTYIDFSEGAYHGHSVPNKGISTITQVNFTPSNANIKTLSLNPEASPVFVWIANDGTIARAVATKLSDVQTLDASINIKTISEIKESANDAIIVSLDHGNIDPYDIKPGEIQEVKITQIELAYLLEKPEFRFLQPIIVYTGNTKIKGHGKEGLIDVTLYLTAQKK